MGDVWRLTVGGKVQESESFTPLMNHIQKLVNRRVPFKIGFGQSIEATVEGALEPSQSRAEEEIPPDDF